MSAIGTEARNSSSESSLRKQNSEHVEHSLTYSSSDSTVVVVARSPRNIRRMDSMSTIKAFIRKRASSIIIPGTEGSLFHLGKRQAVSAGSRRSALLQFTEGSHREWPPFILSPFSKFKVVWDGIVVVAICYNSVVLPYLVAFKEPNYTCPEPRPIFISRSACYAFGFELFNQLTLWLFWIDMLVIFRSSYVAYPEVVTDSKAIAKHYLKGSFWLDLVVCFPFSNFGYLIFPNATALDVEMLILLRLLKAQRIFQVTQSVSDLSRLCLLLIGILMLAHWIGCIWWLVAKIQLARDSDVEYFTGEPWSKVLGLDEASGYTQWTVSMYWALSVLTTVEAEVLIGTLGYVAPSTDTERIVAMFFQLVGAVSAGALIGNVVGIVAQWDIVASRYRDKMHEINQFMQFHRVPKDLRMRVRNNSAFQHDLTNGASQSLKVLKDLPLPLQRELQLQLLGPILKKVDFFRKVNSSFLKEVCMILVQEIFLPGDMVVVCGDLANEMYFISRGQLQVASGDGKVLYKVLSSGDYFGERMLIDDQPKRSATVQCISYCEMYYTTKEPFMKLLGNFPEYKEALLTDIAKKYAEPEDTEDTLAQNKTNSTAKGMWKKVGTEMRPKTESDFGTRAMKALQAMKLVEEKRLRDEEELEQIADSRNRESHRADTIEVEAEPPLAEDEGDTEDVREDTTAEVDLAETKRKNVVTTAENQKPDL
eukprot:gene17656-21037_t